MDFAEHVWIQFQEAIKKRFSRNTYATWFEPLVFERQEGNRLIVTVPDEVFIRILTKTYGNVVKAVLYEIGHQEIEFEYFTEKK